MLLSIVTYISSVHTFLVHGRIVLLCPYEVRLSHLTSSDQRIIGRSEVVLPPSQNISVQIVRPLAVVVLGVCIEKEPFSAGSLRD